MDPISCLNKQENLDHFYLQKILFGVIVEIDNLTQFIPKVNLLRLNIMMIDEKKKI
jgi:hypothetical protein